MLCLFFKVSQYDEDMMLLKASDLFIETLEKALQTKGWPSDDQAQKGLNTQTIGLYADAQTSRKSGQLLSSHSQCEDLKSRVGAGSLKRERSISPMSEGPTKCPHGEPTLATSFVSCKFLLCCPAASLRIYNQ
ncbi:hypothetical protein BDN67DRAFT_976047 [Paxillus ammoniavirescens]|nr:hypothetical protein BDN67DRAFT_976047 [Paxillus ammoniavirescens]